MNKHEIEKTPHMSLANDVGKRKLFNRQQEEESYSKFESLDLESDDDVLIVNAGEEEDALLLGSDDEMPPPNPVPLPRPGLKAHRSCAKDFEPRNNDTSREHEAKEDSKGNEICQMKWLRTVGLNEGGSLVCTVSSAVDNESESGHSGKTESLYADTIRQMMVTYKKRRSQIVDKQGIVATPLHVVKKLANQHQEALHVEITGLPNGVFSVELFSGSVRGIGEAINKRIAAQMAAIDLLEKVQLSGGTVKVPPFGFFPGWLTSNAVFADLNTLCELNSQPKPRITCVAKSGVKDIRSEPPFRAECWVGDLVTISENENSVFARRDAAREMYNLISQAEYKDIPYAIGPCCRRAVEFKKSGGALPLSDFKKKWLLKYRVVDGKLHMPEEEVGMDVVSNVNELACDIADCTVDDDFGLELEVQKKKLKVTIPVKKDGPVVTRVVSVEKLDDNCDSDDEYF